MWWWKALVFAVLLHAHTSSQPISDDSTNDRVPRQLDFEKCCPCDRSDSDRDAGFEELLADGTEGIMRSRTGDMDCPCRFRDSDAQGASSVFFPTAMRAAGSFLSPGEKKEDLKPLFNPEVDLASSVLQTLREVTDQEYQEALARDAAKSARTADDVILGDTIPQESANIVTIVVNPSSRLTDDDDTLPQASHIQQSRCIHPLQSTRSHFGKMRMAPKPSSILHKPRLPKSRPRLLHRNLYHVDSGMGASNVHEHVIPFDDDNLEKTKTDTSPLRLLEGANGYSSSSNNDVDEGSNLSKGLDLQSKSLQSKFKDFDISRSPLLRSIREKTIKSLSSVPKLRLGSLVPEEARNENEDLSQAASTLHEREPTKAFRTNSPLGNFRQKSRPLSLSNLLNLRDVELIPLKDLVNNKADSGKMNNPKFALPSSFSRDDAELHTNEVDVDPAPLKELVHKTLVSDKMNKSKFVLPSHFSRDDAESPTNEIDVDPAPLKDLVHKKLVSDKMNESKFALPSLFSRDDAESPNNEVDVDPAPLKDLVHKKLGSDKINKSKFALPSLFSRDDAESPNNEVDVDPAPLKDLVHKKLGNDKINKSKFALPSLFSHDDTGSPYNEVGTDPAPLNDLVHKKLGSDKMSKFALPSLFSRDDAELPSNEVDVDTENGKNTHATKDETGDSEGSPSLVYNQVRSIDEQVDVDDCEQGLTELKSDTNAEENDRQSISTEVLDKLPGSIDELPKDASFTEDTECIEGKNDDQDSVTDASNNINNLIEPQETETDNIHNLSEDSKLIPDELYHQDEQTNDSFKTLDKKPKLKLLDHASVDKTIATIKENIAKKLQELKNMQNNMKNKNLLNRENVNEDRENKDEPITSSENHNFDCENESSMQITTLAPNEPDVNSENMITPSTAESSERSDDTTRILTADVLNDNTNNANDCSDKEVSIQDLQQLSDSMLQKEEREREAKILNNNEPSVEMTVNPLDNNKRDNGWLDSDKSADTRVETVVEPENLDIIQSKNTEAGACRSDLALAEPSLSSQTDASHAASNILMNTFPKQSDFLGSQRILQPALNLFNKPLPRISDALKLPSLDPLPVLDDVSEKLTDLFAKNDDGFAPLETKALLPDTKETSNPVMATDASTSSFQSRKPPTRFLEDVNFDIFDLNPTSSIPSNIPKLGLNSYKTKIPLPKDLSLKPIKSQSALKGEKTGIGKSNFRTNNEPFKFFNDPLEIRPRLNEVEERDLPLEATNHIHSTLKKAHRALESRLREAANNNFNILKNPIRGSPSLLETLSRNHEDINDKLQGLHMDLNDRLETMHNEFKDSTKLFTSGSHHTKPNLRSSSIFNKQKKTKQPLKHTWPTSNRRESHKFTTSRKPVKITPPLKTTERKKFRMPTAASVQVPRTVQVPELKKASSNSIPLTLQQGSTIVPKWDAAAPRPKGILDNSGRQSPSLQNHKKLLRTEFNPLKDSKIKVSFSTTPRSTLVASPHLKNSDIEKKLELFGSRMMNGDHDVSPSEVKKSLISAPDAGHLNKNIHSKIGMDRERTPQKLSASEEDNLQTSERGKHFSKSAFRSWPKANESYFLTKVREAVKTRLSKVNSAKSLKQTGLGGDEEVAYKPFPESNLDMTRSATEIKEIVDPQTLKENVSYKCKMVCTKDQHDS